MKLAELPRTITQTLMVMTLAAASSYAGVIYDFAGKGICGTVPCPQERVAFKLTTQGFVNPPLNGGFVAFTCAELDSSTNCDSSLPPLDNAVFLSNQGFGGLFSAVLQFDASNATAYDFFFPAGAFGEPGVHTAGSPSGGPFNPGTLTVTETPEPGPGLLLLPGICLFGLALRRRGIRRVNVMSDAIFHSTTFHEAKSVSSLITYRRNSERPQFRSLAALVFTVVVMASALPLRAGIVMFTDRTTWTSASSNLLTLSFAGLGGSPDQAYPSGLTVDGVTFTGSLSYLSVRTSPNVLYGPPDRDLGTCDARWSICPPDGHITTTLPAGVTSVGWDFSTFYHPPDVTVIFPDRTTFSEAGPGFIGFISTSPIRSLEIHSLNGPIVSAFSFNTAPEPSMISMLIGAAALGFLRTRSRRNLPGSR